MRFFLIDKITCFEPGNRAEGLKNVSLSEDFFQDHFPRRPVMPGMLIIEGLAQLGGLLLEESHKKENGEIVKAVVTIMVRIKFRDMVKPGSTLNYEAELASSNSMGGRVQVKAMLNGKRVVETLLTFGFKRLDDDQLDMKRQKLLRLWMQE